MIRDCPTTSACPTAKLWQERKQILNRRVKLILIKRKKIKLLDSALRGKGVPLLAVPECCNLFEQKLLWQHWERQGNHSQELTVCVTVCQYSDSIVQMLTQESTQKQKQKKEKGSESWLKPQIIANSRKLWQKVFLHLHHRVHPSEHQELDWVEPHQMVQQDKHPPLRSNTNQLGHCEMRNLVNQRVKRLTRRVLTRIL